MKRFRPFSFDSLRHISSEHRALHAELARALPDSFFSSNLGKRLADLLRKELDVDVGLWLDSVRFFSRTQIRALIPGPTCLLVVGMAPREEKVIIEIDLYFVYRAVGKLLGTKSSIDVHRPLTEIEQGVFLFLALKAFGLVASDFQSPEQLAFRVEDIRNDVRSCAEVLRTDDWWLAFTYKFYYDTDSGVIRVLVPRSFARGVVYAPPPEGTTLALRRRNRIRARLRPFRKMPVDGYIDVGTIELTRRDLMALEPGDIVLLEQTSVRLEDEVPIGPAQMRIGLGKSCAIHGSLAMNEGVYVFGIEDIVVEKVPDSHDPVEGHGEAQNPEEVVAGYEEHGQEEGYDESNDGFGSSLDRYDEDYGLDDENAGDDDEYAEEEGYGEEQYEEEQGYDEGAEGGEQAEEQQEGAEDQEPDDNLAQSEPLLGDIPMVVVVELGRVQLTADEVIRLRPGQLIEVGRKPNDLLVDLVVNGKLVAKGKLVEIEGALGVELA
ncbi:MAG: FliM/FliN family flagellar motor switch protein, partial [Deltaproteobacteria bacterium]|nr:FliM/FliN family flagellar motor switch protein [Deltaproteobacteria bacterium]